MDELTRYVFVNFSNLMTLREHAAYKSILGEEKAETAQSVGMQRMLRKNWISSDPEVLRLLENGAEQFYRNVVQRIMQDRPTEVFFNRCPKCHSLARTPQAKQCPHCFFSWHDPN